MSDRNYGMRRYTKLDADKVRAIRLAYVGGQSLASLAREYGVTAGCVKCVVAGKTWADVKDEPAKGVKGE